MKRIVVIGAFDRYNYGDNLMPILFEIFLKDFYPDVFLNYKIIYSALTDSDLSKYKAKKTVAMYRVLNRKKENPHSIISIGGEILCSSSSTLFLHMNSSKKSRELIVFLRKNKMSLLANLICRSYYRLPWEYPYIPQKKFNTLTAFNTIGGSVPKLNLGVSLNKVRKRLSDADYLSVRDTRVVDSLSAFSEPNLFPDSAIVMAELITDDFLVNECSDEINQLKYKSYVCFQIAPKKSDASAAEWAEILSKISKRYNLEIILCPIGYANGHDDVDFLREINNKSLGSFRLLYELSIWEIMSTIKNSKIFLGTSLHGIITALSFSIPYIGLNPKVCKLDIFLKDWGFGVSKRCYSSYEVLDIIDSVLEIEKHEFNKHSMKLRELGMNNNHELVSALSISKDRSYNESINSNGNL